MCFMLFKNIALVAPDLGKLGFFIMKRNSMYEIGNSETLVDSLAIFIPLGKLENELLVV